MRNDRLRDKQNRKLKTLAWFITIIFISGYYIKSLYRDIDSLREQVYTHKAKIDSQQNYINDLIYKSDSISKKETEKLTEVKKQVYYQPIVKKDSILIKKDSLPIDTAIDTLNSK